MEVAQVRADSMYIWLDRAPKNINGRWYVYGIAASGHMKNTTVLGLWLTRGKL